MDIFIQFAIAASQFAMDDSGLKVTPEIAPRVGVFIASGIGGFTTIEREHKALLEGGPRRISPFFIPSAIINLASGQVSIRFGAQGPNSATCTACTASAHALGDASEIIRRGAADVMIAGGSEAAVCAMGIGGFAAMRALSTRNDDPAAIEPSLRPRPRRLRAGRGRRRAGARGAGIREGARRTHLRRARRLRHVGRRLPHDSPLGRRRRRLPGDEGRTRLRRRRGRTRSITSTPMAPRRRTTTASRRSPSSGASATTRADWPSRRPSR